MDNLINKTIIFKTLSGGHSKSLCECAYDTTNNSFDMNVIFEAEKQVIIGDKNSLEYKNSAEILSDYDNMFIMNIDKCKNDKLKALTW